MAATGGRAGCDVLYCEKLEPDSISAAAQFSKIEIRGRGQKLLRVHYESVQAESFAEFSAKSAIHFALERRLTKVGSSSLRNGAIGIVGAISCE
jgi:hypothetical protein